MLYRTNAQSRSIEQAMVKEGLKNVAAGANPISIKLGMEKATQYLVTQINEFAQSVEEIQSIQQVASISAGNDDIIGSLIADALAKVGKEGVISLEEGKGIVTELEITEGMKLEKGFISPYFVTNTDKMEVSYDNPLILLTDKKIFILGAGGVVPSIGYALNKMGAINISISNRTKAKAQTVKDIFNNLNIVDWGEVPEFDIIINATSLGLNKDDKIELNFSSVGKNKLFYDVIYNPSETSFLKEGKKLGNRSENGKLMFIYQAHEAFKIWHGIEPNVDNKTIKLIEND